MFLLYGLLCAVHERSVSGRGQVVDAAMIDGASALLTPIFEMTAHGQWHTGRGTNLFDGGSFFYTTYKCADGLYISIAALEPQFYVLLREKLGLHDPVFASHMESRNWPALTERLAALFVTRTREAWTKLLEGTDVCFAPVLDLLEAPHHPHNRARASHVEVGGVVQPAPAPRLSRTPGAVQGEPPRIGANTEAVISEWLAT
jgi:alpha-methylacyl-CoA racemase